ncbi:MAG TPA: DUF6029 family protein [Vulgatibacter sp.]|nr:DUF6029 family protein [Vulgatibacter sp.]
MKQRAALGFLLLALVPASSRAANLRLLDTTVFEYRGANRDLEPAVDEFGLGLTKLYLDGRMDDTTLGLQIDAAAFTNRPDAPTSPSAYRDDARLERITLTHTMGDAQFTLGDSHLQLGRGIALSLRRVDELGSDQALRGGGVGWQGDLLSAKAFAGVTNLANLDAVTQRWMRDPSDVLAGASAIVHVGRADVSVHGLYLRPRESQVPAIADQDHTALGGAYVDLPMTDWLSLYAEGAIEQYRIIETIDRGTALYAAADVDLRVVSLLVEGLLLDKFEVMGSTDELLNKRITYNQPPTLERIDQEVLDNRDVRGGRVKVSRSFLDGSLVLYTSGMLRRFGVESAATDAIHGYGGFEYTYGGGRSRWYASAGYREERLAVDGHLQKTMGHAETDWVQSIGGPWALHLTFGHEQRTLDDHDYVRGTSLVGFDRAGWGSLMAEVGYDTQYQERQQLFLAGILAWTTSDWLTVKAVVGSQRGGIKCIGGVCRDFPAFSGARLEATMQYDVL